jgi:hypothetical protein
MLGILHWIFPKRETNFQSSLHPLCGYLWLTFLFNHRGRREDTENRRVVLPTQMFFLYWIFSEESNSQFSSEYWRKLHQKQSSNQDDVA